MDVQAAVFSCVEEAWRDEEAEGHRDDEVDGLAAGLGHLSADRGFQLLQSLGG